MAFANMMNPGCNCCGPTTPPGRLGCGGPSCPTLPRTIELSLSDLSDFLSAGTLTFRENGEFPSPLGYPVAWWSDFIQYFESEAGHYNRLACEYSDSTELFIVIEDWQAGGAEDTPILISHNVVVYAVPRDGSCDPLLLSAYSEIAGVTATISG